MCLCELIVNSNGARQKRCWCDALKWALTINGSASDNGCGLSDGGRHKCLVLIWLPSKMEANRVVLANLPADSKRAGAPELARSGEHT